MDDVLGSDLLKDSHLIWGSAVLGSIACAQGGSNLLPLDRPVGGSIELPLLVPSPVNY